MKYTNYIFSAGVLLILCLGIGWVYYSEQPSTPFPQEKYGENNSSRYRQLVSDWSGVFKENAVAEAYEQYLTYARELSYSEAHELSHIVGEALYRKLGVQGIEVCTPDFGFGCYHGFSGTVLTEEGTAKTESLVGACRKTELGFFLGCMHGIGHGILAYLGSAELNTALSLCAPLQSGEAIGGCLGGIFMEYNFNTMQSLDGIQLRPFDPSHPRFLCETTISSAFRTACYYEIPSWWRASLETLGYSSEEQYRTIGAYCSAIEDVALRDICARGIGNVIGAVSSYEPTVMRESCSFLSTEEGRTLCFVEALGHLLQTEVGKETLERLCKEKIIDYPAYCAIKE